VGDRLGRIRSLNERIGAITAGIAQSESELSMLRHIDDDAQRDAAVTANYDDRASAKMTSGDVRRMEKQIGRLQREKARLVRERDRLIVKLAAG